MHGIDLGGSYARIAWPDPAGRTATGAAVPATVHVAGPGDLRVSRAWGALSARSRLFAGATEDSVGPQELTACVLAALAQRSLAGGGDLPQTVALAVPAAARTGPGGATGNGMEPALRSAVTRAGLTVGQVLPEPVATALHYETIREGANLSVLVYDQGATSSDLTLLAIDADRTVRVLESRTEPIGGDRWDEAIAGELLRRLGSPRPRRARCSGSPSSCGSRSARCRWHGSRCPGRTATARSRSTGRPSSSWSSRSARRASRRSTRC